MKGILEEKVDELDNKKPLEVQDALLKLTEALHAEGSQQLSRDMNSFASTVVDAIEDLKQSVALLVENLEPKEVDTMKVNGEVSVTNFPEHDESAMPKMLELALREAFSPLVEVMQENARISANQHEELVELLTSILEKESAEPEQGGGDPHPKQKALKWKRAMFPATAGVQRITGAFNGTTNFYYLPWSPTKDSETIRLNQGSPLSGGIDYTIVGNKVTHTRTLNSDDQVEVRSQ